MQEIPNSESITVATVPTGRVFPIPLPDFTDEEKATGEERRDFEIEVERLRIVHGLSYEACCEYIGRREWAAAHRHDGTLHYRKLFIGGQRYASQLTFWNFVRWKRVWAQWRHGSLDTQNWQCLCPRNRFREIHNDDGSVRFESRTMERAGDATFWALFAHYYESTVQRTRQKAYELARDGALESGVAAERIPQLHQVAYFYREKVPAQAVERAREGEQRYYDVLTVPVIRNWRKVQPNLCWSGDHHVFNLFARVPDEARVGFRPVRPWLSDWIDVSSWFTTGWHISRQPSRDTIELALRRGIETTGGVPKHLYFDNGKDYQAFSSGGRFGYDPEQTHNICAAFGIHPIFALPHNPRAKLNERNYRILERFEQQWFTYCGRNERHMRTLWDTKREDGFTLRERLERYPKKHPLAGCLVRPELLPDLDQVRVTFAKWLASERHHMVSQGRVCPGQSPAQRYNAAPEPKLLRPVSADEIALAFLRVHHQTIKIKRNGSFQWTPPGGSPQDRLVFADAALRPLAGERVQVRFDNLEVFPPRVFAFHRHEYDDHGERYTTWKLVACSGVAGSVPNLIAPDAIVEGEDASQALRNALAASRRLDREIKRGKDARAERKARKQLECWQGLRRGANFYHLKPREILDQITANREDKARR